jgi:hypothetical protein
MLEKPSLRGRWEDSRESKTGLIWACAAFVFATMIVGFTWGGW